MHISPKREIVVSRGSGNHPIKLTSKRDTSTVHVGPSKLVALVAAVVLSGALLTLGKCGANVL
jgi:hypothetical protein